MTSIPGLSEQRSAVSWLRHARDAYRAAGQADAWERYLAEVRATYGRKYKLMGLLKTL